MKKFSFKTLGCRLNQYETDALVTQFHQAKPQMEGTVFIDGLTAVFLGALIIKAGKPNVIGTLIGAVFLAVLGNGFTHLGVSSYVGDMIKGALMIFGVVIIAVSRYRLAHKPQAG